VRANDVGGDLGFLVPRTRRTRRRKAASSDADLGGGTGTQAPPAASA
jgi:hypothetical protein